MAAGPASPVTPDQQHAADKITGIRAAAGILMQRLYDKDPRRWVHVALLSPSEIVPWPDQPDLLDTGRRLAVWLQEHPGCTLAMSPEGRARVLTPQKNEVTA